MEIERRTEPEPSIQVERSIDLPADAADVWSALTDADLAADWLGDEVELDPRPGGALRLVDENERREGRVDDVDAGRRLSFRWWPQDRPHAASRVVISITPIPGGTRVGVTERLAPVAGAPRATACAGVPVAAGFLSARRAVLLAATAVRVLVRA